MSEECVSREVCEARCKRLEDEDARQNHRIDKLEQTVEKIHELATATEKMADNMAKMLEEQRQQGQRLSALEGRDGQKWRKVIGAVVTGVVGALVGALMMKLGLS